MIFFSLLFQEVEVQEVSEDDPKEAEKLKKTQVSRTFANWLMAYFIYMGVVLQQIDMGTALVKYLEVVYQAY